MILQLFYRGLLISLSDMTGVDLSQRASWTSQASGHTEKPYIIIINSTSSKPFLEVVYVSLNSPAREIRLLQIHSVSDNSSFCQPLNPHVTPLPQSLSSKDAAGCVSDSLAFLSCTSHAVWSTIAANRIETGAENYVVIPSISSVGYLITRIILFLE